MSNRKDFSFLVGTKVGEWTVLSLSNFRKYEYKSGKVMVQYCTVRCSCGNTSEVSAYSLVARKSNKCKVCVGKLAPKPPILSGTANAGYRGTQNISKDYFSGVRRKAEKRNYEFSVSIEDLQNQWDLQNGKCAYTGVQLICARASKSTSFVNPYEALSNKASLDRIDSTIGYTPGNIEWVSATINSMKTRLSEKVFLEIIANIYNHRILR